MAGFLISEIAGSGLLLAAAAALSPSLSPFMISLLGCSCRCRLVSQLVSLHDFPFGLLLPLPPCLPACLPSLVVTFLCMHAQLLQVRMRRCDLSQPDLLPWFISMLLRPPVHRLFAMGPPLPFGLVLATAATLSRKLLSLLDFLFAALG